ncbi:MULTISPECIES: ATP-binding cassette domain-containing protein [Edwardsiella]|uniref:Peptide ABC transporter ATP-binding protein n=3 Tax=Edwardsiella tarda TaxID=636 RepID=A0A2A7U3R7_EDWTA|nr:ATP-binding cassette domain-containing protein [Edwardsiella tarda]ATI62889.1 peptide ABC transporter ATP-binding protein [Edwardsiella tarda]EFE23219.1 ABC transporter, ATP-binding protein [Edwardsiella tarda ATCC 23685]PEH72883.1 peptide ABC transporter ATP-binding protein [Edwardsiella tarda]UAL55063.1 ATP-binding cassette domain-containing protein [Edwardsiella tarda]UCP98877.1 ATP-binding cassette domain-containing protein [Edwardsiella tarda ATCC 15947 = NBRC 105688]
MLSFQAITLEAAHYRWYGARRWSPLLRGISLDVAPGELVALVGGSGEGKSLLLQCALDLLPNNLRSHGTLSLDGKPLSAECRRRLRGHTLCYVPQGVSALNPLLNIERHLQRTRHLAGQHWDVEQASAVLRQSQLDPAVMQRYPRQLSGGMAKRVLACHASLSHARYILADEITAWLDESLACQLLQQLRRLCDQGCGILWVTHDLMLAARYADRIVALHQGEVCDSVSRAQLQRGEISARLMRQWQALPERVTLFPTAETMPC